MSLFLKQFSTHSEYEQYINGGGVILPNVSLTLDNNTVHYNPSSPTPPTPDEHLYAKIFDEYGTFAACDSLGKLIWFDVNGERNMMIASTTETEGGHLNSSYYITEPYDVAIEDFEPSPIASITDITDIGGMTILGSLATNLSPSDEYEVVFDPLATILTE